MKNCLTISHFFISFLCCLSAFAISDDAVIDWGSPIVEAGRTGCVYPIKYTKTEPPTTVGNCEVSTTACGLMASDR